MDIRRPNDLERSSNEYIPLHLLRGTHSQLSSVRNPHNHGIGTKSNQASTIDENERNPTVSCVPLCTNAGLCRKHSSMPHYSSELSTEHPSTRTKPDVTYGLRTEERTTRMQQMQVPHEPTERTRASANRNGATVLRNGLANNPWIARNNKLKILGLCGSLLGLLTITVGLDVQSKRYKKRRYVPQYRRDAILRPLSVHTKTPWQRISACGSDADFIVSINITKTYC